MDRVLAIVIGVPLGFLIIVYRFQVKQFTGNIAFAEQYLGAGGTYNLFIIIGLAVSILSMMYGLGTLQELFEAYIGPFFVHGQ